MRRKSWRNWRKQKWWKSRERRRRRRSRIRHFKKEKNESLWQIENEPKSRKFKEGRKIKNLREILIHFHSSFKVFWLFSYQSFESKWEQILKYRISQILDKLLLSLWYWINAFQFICEYNDWNILIIEINWNSIRSVDSQN